jgi:hypothetical protein
MKIDLYFLGKRDLDNDPILYAALVFACLALFIKAFTV